MKNILTETFVEENKCCFGNHCEISITILLTTLVFQGIIVYIIFDKLQYLYDVTSIVGRRKVRVRLASVVHKRDESSLIHCYIWVPLMLIVPKLHGGVSMA